MSHTHSHFGSKMSHSHKHPAKVSTRKLDEFRVGMIDNNIKNVLS